MTTECIPWHRVSKSTGYGRVEQNGLAHRHVWQECFGVIPDGVDVHHVCGTRNCVNPEHLALIDHAEHARLHDNCRASQPVATAAAVLANTSAPLQTHCKHGHKLTPDNIYPRPTGRGRSCRACAIRRARERKERLRALPLTTELATAVRADDAVVTGVDDGQPELTEAENA